MLENAAHGLRLTAVSVNLTNQIAGSKAHASAVCCRGVDNDDFISRIPATPENGTEQD
ncbi:hypothetical protein [Szabonella alba]|uniref:Uncharacterized protein n=1 Tax=Szabonella alba TaxID=2804194 RepID=A0A8K0V5P3_9RHOB|nr:hypothetical protein [Szabonella alba]MBL4915907.1 hypothetical protein [Szabonella alba]